jgi:hypothetical protein
LVKLGIGALVVYVMSAVVCVVSTRCDAQVPYPALEE